jgi:hypothetical protein
MTFIHEHPEFEDLLAVVAKSCHLPSAAMVEKDYWITHTLWALGNAGLEVWFKGGTSLSKGFGIIQRFSEDLDLKIGPGVSGLPEVSRWKSGGKGAIGERTAFFSALAGLPLPGLTLRLDGASLGKTAEGAMIMADYVGAHQGSLPAVISPHVLLEVGDARVRPSLVRPVSSWVHDHLVRSGMAGEFAVNVPSGVNCVHPLVTLIEKLDAISHRFAKEDVAAAAFVRHYEDAAHIIRGMGALPILDGYGGTGALVREMLGQRQIRKAPEPDDACFNPAGTVRWDQIGRAYADIQPLFWGPRLSLVEATDSIRTFMGSLDAGL